jgi:hypothetical protein
MGIIARRSLLSIMFPRNMKETMTDAVHNAGLTAYIWKEPRDWVSHDGRPLRVQAHQPIHYSHSLESCH